jgi:hypothetical protein
MELLLEGYPVIVHTDKMGRWKYDLIEIKDVDHKITLNLVSYILNYLYQEGFVLDRRITTHIIDKENNIIRKYTGLE